MTSDPEDGEAERLLDRLDRVDQGERRAPEPLGDLLRAAAAPDPSRALAGEDAAVTAFRAAREAGASRRPRAAHRRLRALRAAVTAILIVLLVTVAAVTAISASAPSSKPSPGPSSTNSTTDATASGAASPRAASTSLFLISPAPFDDGDGSAPRPGPGPTGARAGNAHRITRGETTDTDGRGRVTALHEQQRRHTAPLTRRAAMHNASAERGRNPGERVHLWRRQVHTVSRLL